MRFEHDIPLKNPIASAGMTQVVYLSLTSPHHISLLCRCQHLTVHHPEIYMHRLSSAVSSLGAPAS